jgi:hypothetical protein
VTEAGPPGGPHQQQEPLPPLDPAQRLILPVADAFMILMLSRPPSGSLRTTRVTVASIALGAAAFAAFGVVGLLVAIHGRLPLLVLAGTLLELFALGCLSLALYGLLQRLHGGAND